jgi:hypothetical protein
VGDRSRLVATVGQQAAACAELGSPMYADLLTRVADDIAAAGPCAQVLRGHEDDPGPSALALRLLGSVHRLVLAGFAPALARYYPSSGGSWVPDTCWSEFRATVEGQAEAVRALLDQPPQTNEVGRSAALLGGMLHAAKEHGLPIRLLEIGCSAGLNLRADHFCYHSGSGRVWGSPESRVQLAGAWQGNLPPMTAALEVVERHGVDVAPIDPFSDDGRLTLMAYVWPDQTDRFERLRGAIEVAARVPATVRQRDAAAFLQTIELQGGSTTVLWHSVMWQYVRRRDQQTMTERVSELGSLATASRPFVHLFLEPTRRRPGSPHEFLVVTTSWPDGERRILGDAHGHGIPVTWT